MRVLHTSDWHLGRRLQTESLVEHQRTFLHWLADLAVAQRADAILVSGDVFDRAIPPVEAVHLFEEALARLSAVCPVILISGNHDSATRLGFGGPFFEASRVHLRTGVADIDRPVVITDESGTQTLVYGLPYLEPEVVRAALDAGKSHEAVLTAAMALVRADLEARAAAAEAEGRPAPRSIVMAHAFITGGSPSDSERDVSVGGIADAPATVFAGVDYVALGHLHGPQEIAHPDAPPTRYSGSPLAYSFSEEAHRKSVTVVDLAGDGTVTTSLVETPVPRRLRTITGDLDTLLSDPDLASAVGDWVRAIVTDPRRPENPMDALRTRFPHTIELAWRPHIDGAPVPDLLPRLDPVGADPVEVVTAFIEHVTAVPATDAERALVHESVERLRIAEASR